MARCLDFSDNPDAPGLCSVCGHTRSAHVAQGPVESLTERCRSHVAETALREIRRYCDENLGPSRSSLLAKIAHTADVALEIAAQPPAAPVETTEARGLEPILSSLMVATLDHATTSRPALRAKFREILHGQLRAEPQEATEPVSSVPEDTWGAFGYLVSRCASGLYKELVEKGRTDAQARNAIIHSFLDMASGEACRVARREGREPDESKWQKATKDAFDRAVARTSSLTRPQSETGK